MNKILLMAVAVAALDLSGVITVVNGAYASGSSSDLPTREDDFIKHYVEAVNLSSLDHLTKLMHPLYLKCIDASSRDYYDNLFTTSIVRSIPKDYKVVFEELTAESVLQDTEGAQKRGLPYPIHPTHQMQIDYSKSEYSFVTIVRKLTLDKGQYYGVSGCPTPEMLNRFRELKVKKEESHKQSKVLFNQLDSKLLIELTSLMKQGQKIQAWKLYSKETGESLSTAKEVLSNILIDN